MISTSFHLAGRRSSTIVRAMKSPRSCTTWTGTPVGGRRSERGFYFPNARRSRRRRPMTMTTKIPIRDVELCLWETLGDRPASSDQLIYLHKDRAFLHRLEAVAARIQPKQMIEIGILD